MGLGRVIIADDDPAMRSWLRDELELRGAVVVEATNGSELMEALDEQTDVSLVITDVRMPGRSGLRGLAQARSVGVLSPFVVITAFPEEELRAAVTDLEDAALLEKPFDIVELCALAERLLAGVRGRAGGPVSPIPAPRGRRQA